MTKASPIILTPVVHIYNMYECTITLSLNETVQRAGNEIKPVIGCPRDPTLIKCECPFTSYGVLNQLRMISKST